jgi:hypothetical protein
MAKHPISTLILIGFSIVMVALLMLDDPAQKQADMLAFGATQQAIAENLLFPAIEQSSQIIGIEVQDVTTGKGILVMRDEAGSWYAPAIAGGQEALAAGQIDQTLVEQAAGAFMLFWAEQYYEITPENLQLFGLEPKPRYRIRFRLHRADGKNYDAQLDVGNANLNDMAYYVYITAVSDQDRRIYLINKQTVDIVLTMLSELILAESAAEPAPTANETTEAETPVP